MKDKPYTGVLNRLPEIVNFLGKRTVVAADATGSARPSSTSAAPPHSVSATTRRTARRPRSPRARINTGSTAICSPSRSTTSGTAGAGAKGGYHVPKVDLIETLDRMFEAGRLEISTNLAEAETLKGELLSLRRNGSTYEPHSSLVHDDLLMALALAAWRVGCYRKDLLQPPPDVYKRPA